MKTLQERLIEKKLTTVKIEGGWNHQLLDIIDECEGRNSVGIVKVLTKKLGLYSYTSNRIQTIHLLRSILRNKYKRNRREEEVDRILAMYSRLSYNITNTKDNPISIKR